MKEIHTYTINNLPIDKTDWVKIAKLSDKEIEFAAREDKDAALITKKQLRSFKSNSLPTSAKCLYLALIVAFITI